MEPPSVLSKVFKLVLLVDLIALNLVVAYLGYKFQIPSINSQINSNIQTPVTQVNDVCGPDCQKYIDSKFIKPTPVPTPTPAVIYKTAPKTKVRNVYYVSVPGSGSTLANNWVDLAGTEFYFDKNDYPGLVEVYFEVNAHLTNGNGMAFVRLYDTGHGVGVQGSDVQTNSQASKLVVSGQVTFWAGKNLIRVQAKSLTADTAIFDSGRLRIVTEN